MPERPASLVDHLTPPTRRKGPRGPLSGIVIADFTRILAGPYCTMLLADMGATVIKVEAPTGDDSRTWIPPERDGVSTYYLAVNRNKHSIVLDLRDPADLEIAHELVAEADVLIENFKPGGLSRYGLDSAQTTEAHPQLVHTSITGFGSGDGKDMPGYDLLVQGLSGLMSVTGSPERDPQRAGVAMFDVITGLHAATGILAALHERGVSGRGQHLELDLLSSALSGLVNQTAGYAACGNVPQRLGNDHPSLYPYGPFPTADKDLIICAGNDRQFARLAEQLGFAWAAEDPQFATMKARNKNRNALHELLVEALGRHTAEHWFQTLQKEGIPCAPILNIGEGVEFAEHLGLNPVVPTGGKDEEVPTIKHPVQFSRTPAHYTKAPPGLGADSDQVREWIRIRSNRPAQEQKAAP